MLKDSQLVSREVLSPQPLSLFLRPWLYVFLPLARGGPQPPRTVRSESRGLQVQDRPIPTAPPETVESQAGGLSEPLGPCQLAGLDPLFGSNARAAVTLVAVQSPEPLPGGPVAALALCPTVPLLPSGSLWRLPASLPSINRVCRIYFLRQFISADAIWVCPQVGRMLCGRQSRGARLYCQADRRVSPAPLR